MRIAVISDIHGNMEALDRVLSDIDRSDIDKIISLGDNIGYGSESDQVVHLIRKRNIESVMGNHELAVSDSSRLELFNPIARRSLERTVEFLSDESIEFVCGLKPFLLYDGCRYVHGFPPDSIITYLFEISFNILKRVMDRMHEAICFVGHTHLLEIVCLNGSDVNRMDLSEGVTNLHQGEKYIINSGSVGQPRDGDNRAKYIIWDTADSTIEVKCIAYDIESAARKIIAAGFPKVHARRLW
ncbi:metallophosphoesterase family protein [Thermodesulfobacteriota bacterium]